MALGFQLNVCISVKLIVRTEAHTTMMLNATKLNSITLFAKTVLTLFSTRVKMSAYSNPFIELAATVLDATPQINSCMITRIHTFDPLYSKETNKATFKSFL